MQAALKVLRYVKNVPYLNCTSIITTTCFSLAFSDSDWGAYLLIRRSTTGLCFYLGTSLISWKSKKQHTVSRSSLEAEYCTLANTTCEATWLKFLLQDFNIPITKPILIYFHNRSTIQIATNPVFHDAPNTSKSTATLREIECKTKTSI